MRCPWCAAEIVPVWVASHTQCPRCRQVIEPCCEGAPQRPGSTPGR